MGIVDVITTVGGAVAAQTIGQGGVFEIAPVGDDIVLIALCPDIGLYGKYDLAVLRIGDAGEDAGYIGLALFAGIKSEIGAKDTRETRLQGIAYHRESGYMEFACLLMGSVLAGGLCALEKATSDVNEVYLIVRILGSGRQGQQYEEKSKGMYFYVPDQMEFIPSQHYGKIAGSVAHGL